MQTVSRCFALKDALKSHFQGEFWAGAIKHGQPDESVPHLLPAENGLYCERIYISFTDAFHKGTRICLPIRKIFLRFCTQRSRIAQIAIFTKYETARRLCLCRNIQRYSLTIECQV